MTGTRRDWTVVALVAWAAACDGPQNAAAPPRPVAGASVRESRSLHGRVARTDGAPLVGAVVRAEPVPFCPGMPDSRKPVEAPAAADGGYELPGVDDGDWAVTCSADGAWRVPQGVVRMPDVRRFDVALPPGAVFDGSLVDDATGAPLAGAKVRALRSGDVLGETVVGADGRFSIDLHRPATQVDEFRVDAAGYAWHPDGWSMGCIVHTFSPGARTPLAFRARRGPVVKGVVRGPSGPVAGAEITAWFDMPAPGEGGSTPTSRTAKTDTGGAYEIAGVESDWCVIRATAPGLVQTEAGDAALRDPRSWPDAAPDACRFKVPEENGATVVPHDVTLVAATPLPRRALRGVVHDGGRMPLAGATVRAGRWFEFVETTSGADGTFALDAPVVDGAVWVSMSRTGYAESAISVESSSNDAAKQFEIALAAAPPLRGRVVDAKGSPAAGAHVLAVPEPWPAGPGDPAEAPPFPARTAAETKSDADGRFSLTFHAIPVGDALVVSAPGFATQRVVLPDDASAETSVVLAALHELTGRVVRSDTGASAGGVRIAELPADAENSRDDDMTRLGRVLAVTADDGSFRIAAIGAGPRRLVAFGATWLPRTFTVEIPLVSTARVDVDPSLTIAGRLVFEDGAPAPDVEVTAYDHPRDADGRWGEQAAPNVRSRPDGRFTISGLRPVRHWIGVEWGEPRIITASIGPMTPDAGVERAIGVARGATIVGRLVDLRGRPVAAPDSTCEPEIRATPSDGDGRPDGRGWVSSGDETGSFTVGGLDHGAYDLAVHARGFVPIRMKNVRADAGPLVLELDPGLALSGVLLGVDGKPLARATIVATPEDPAAADDEARRSCDTDVRGWFRIAGLTPGRWRLDLFRGVTFDGRQRLDGDAEFDAGAEDVRLKCVLAGPR